MKRSGEVGAYRKHGDARATACQCGDRVVEKCIRDIDGDVGAWCSEGVEQQRGLAARTAAEFHHDGVGPDCVGERWRVLGEQRGFSARLIVLVKLGDGFE